MGAVSHGGTDARGFDKEFTRWTVPNVETLSGNKTITSVDARVQLLNTGGAARIVTLDSSLHVEGTVLDIHTTGETGYQIDVKNSAATLIARLHYDQSVKVVYASGAWRIINLPFTAELGADRTNLYIGYRYGVTNTYLSIGSGHKVYVDATGVGIGASPSSLFHVTASGNANALRVDNTTGNTSFGAAPNASFRCWIDNYGSNSYTLAIVNGADGASAAAGIHFYSKNGGGSTARLEAYGSDATDPNLLYIHNVLGAIQISAPTSGKSITMTPGSGGRVLCGGTTSAFRPNVLTTAERDALTPVNGDLIYNSTTGKHEGYNGAWNACY